MDTLIQWLKDWRFLSLIAAILLLSWIFMPTSSSDDTGSIVSPSPTSTPDPTLTASPSDTQSPSSTPTASATPADIAPRLTSITPEAGKVGTQVTIKGSGFSLTGNTITFTAKNKNIYPWYILQAPNFLSTEGGGTIIMGITPPTFIYGECRASNAFCNSKVQKLEPGEYTVTVQAANCPPDKCTSNGLQFIVIQ